MATVLIATGGTIASRPGPGGSVVSQLTGRELLDRHPEIEREGDVEVVEVAHTSSWNLDAATMATVAERAREAVVGGSGVVVTHGTDTIEQTAWLTDLLAGDDTVAAPIVFTCSMRHADESGTDGPRNLRAAFRVADSPAARGWGALVCANGELHAARRVTKTDTTSTATFQSPGSGPVGWITDAEPVLLGPKPTRPARGDGIVTEVGLVATYPDLDPGVVAWHTDRGARGLVIEGTGAGNLPGPIAEAASTAVAEGVAVVVASRCPTGTTSTTYGGPGGGATLAEAGLIAAGDLSGPKARLALMVALGVEPSVDGARRWFADLAEGR